MKRRLFTAAAAGLFLCVFLTAATRDLAVSYRLTAQASPFIVETGARLGPFPVFFIPAWCLRSFETDGKQGVFLRLIEAGLCAACSVELWRDAFGMLAEILLIVISTILIYGLVHQLPLPEQTDGNHRILITYLAAVVAAFATVHLFKMIWGRPRFYVIANGDAEFRNWYEIAGFAIRGDRFYSFPSGHTQGASASLFLFALPELFPSLPRKSVVLPAVSLLFIGFVAFSRIMAGMHFVSDVMAAFAISVFWFLVLRAYACRRSTGEKEKKDVSE